MCAHNKSSLSEDLRHNHMAHTRGCVIYSRYSYSYYDIHSSRAKIGLILQQGSTNVRSNGRRSIGCMNVVLLHAECRTFTIKKTKP